MSAQVTISYSEYSELNGRLVELTDAYNRLEKELEHKDKEILTLKHFIERQDHKNVIVYRHYFSTNIRVDWRNFKKYLSINKQILNDIDKLTVAIRLHSFPLDGDGFVKEEVEYRGFEEVREQVRENFVKENKDLIIKYNSTEEQIRKELDEKLKEKYLSAFDGLRKEMNKAKSKVVELEAQIKAEKQKIKDLLSAQKSFENNLYANIKKDFETKDTVLRTELEQEVARYKARYEGVKDAFIERPKTIDDYAAYFWI